MSIYASYGSFIRNVVSKSQVQRLTYQSILTSNRLINHQQRRFFDLQEYQSKQILHENGNKVQKFKVVSSIGEAKMVFLPHEFGHLKASKWSGMDEDISSSEEFVIKAQVLAGGRGKGKFRSNPTLGGVKLTKSHHEALDFTSGMLNDYLVTKQTGEEGVLVEKVMIAEAVRLKREFYFSIVLDRNFGGIVFITSPYGGADIEEVAAKLDNSIRRFVVPIDYKITFETARKMAVAAFDLQILDLDIIDQCANEMMKLHKLFLKLDATQIEINPLGVTNKRQVICVDAKVNFDENARFRQKLIDELEALNVTETDKRDFEARKHNLNFIGLNGSIGCLVNGAGLAMATMDIIKLHGGEPANFLDVGGGATVDQVKVAFEIINSDKNVKAIFVNIFGGIMRCDTVAQGIIESTKSLNLRLPIVVRLEGTRVKEAKELIKSSQLNIISIDDFDEAAKKAVSMSK